MTKKPKFKPQITKVKLNPEQAVLACQCSTFGKYRTGASNVAFNMCNVQFGKTLSTSGTYSVNSANS